MGDIINILYNINDTNYIKVNSINADIIGISIMILGIYMFFSLLFSNKEFINTNTNTNIKHKTNYFY
jgi:hypothetical protein